MLWTFSISWNHWLKCEHSRNLQNNCWNTLFDHCTRILQKSPFKWLSRIGLPWRWAQGISSSNHSNLINNNNSCIYNAHISHPTGSPCIHESSNVDKIVLLKDKSAARSRRSIEPGLSAWESSEHTNIITHSYWLTVFVFSSFFVQIPHSYRLYIYTVYGWIHLWFQHKIKSKIEISLII